MPGSAQVTVSHADLPMASGLAAVGDAPGITLVPDRYRNGTNVIALPADAGFRFSYGPGSFARHRVEAERLGLPLRVLDLPDLAWDIDEPADVVPVTARGTTRDSRVGGSGRSGAGGQACRGRRVRPVEGPGCRSATCSTPRPSRSIWPLRPRALAIGAHPDDIEFGAGATLAKWAAAGCQVHHLVLTDGSKGSWDPDEDLDRLVADRMDECRRRPTVLGGGVGGRVTGSSSGCSFLGKVDGELDNDEATRREVARIIRTVRPDVVLGHDPWRRYRLHPDHRAAGFLTLDALVAARDPHFFADLGLATHRPRALLLWEADLPNHVERVDGFAEVKVDALLCHHSQLDTTMGLGTGRRLGAVRTGSGDGAPHSPPASGGSWPSTARWPASAPARPST